MGAFMIRFTTHTACILIILLLPWASIASTNDDWKLAGTIVSSIQSPNIPSVTFSIDDNSHTRKAARETIQKTIDKASQSGGGVVVIPKGR